MAAIGSAPSVMRPRAPIPHDDIAAAVLPGGDDTLEVEVVERMILDVHRHALRIGVERRPFGTAQLSSTPPASSRRS